MSNLFQIASSKMVNMGFTPLSLNLQKLCPKLVPHFWKDSSSQINLTIPSTQLLLFVLLTSLFMLVTTLLLWWLLVTPYHSQFYVLTFGNSFRITLKLFLNQDMYIIFLFITRTRHYSMISRPINIMIVFWV